MNESSEAAMRQASWFLTLTTVLFLLAGQASACPNCREAIASQDEMAAQYGKETTFMKNGYNYSVLFMMAMPFTLLGTGAFMVARAVKRGAMPEL
jgi:hypothetical protein